MSFTPGFIPLPRMTRDVVGHEDAVHAFLAAWFGGRMHHAWLLTGNRGIGKATLAYALARWVMAPDRPADRLALPPGHQVVKQVFGGSCPTLCVVEPEEDEKSGLPKEIGVAAARTITPFLRLTAADGQWRVVLIDNADMLNTEAQNAILKILEEPPPRTLLLLTAALPGRLLPTIRSRCRSLKLQPLTDSELRKIAGRLETKLQTDKPWLIKHAQGSIGQLIHLAELDAGALASAVDKIVAQLPKVDWAQVHALAAQVGRKEQDAHFRLVLELLNHAITEKLQSNPAAQGSTGAMWEEMQSKIRLATERHLDRSATLIDLLSFVARAMQQAMVAA